MRTLENLTGFFKKKKKLCEFYLMFLLIENDGRIYGEFINTLETQPRHTQREENKKSWGPNLFYP